MKNNQLRWNHHTKKSKPFTIYRSPLRPFLWGNGGRCKKVKKRNTSRTFFPKKKKKRGFLTPSGQSRERQHLLPVSYAGCIAKLLWRLTGNSNNKGYFSKKRRRRRIEMGWDKFLRWPSLWYKTGGGGAKSAIGHGGVKKTWGIGWNGVTDPFFSLSFLAHN